MKKINLLVLFSTLLVSGTSTLKVTDTIINDYKDDSILINNNIETNDDISVYEEKMDNEYQKIDDVKRKTIGDTQLASSKTYVQYGKSGTNTDLIRFVTAVKGNISSLKYFVTYSGKTETYEVTNVYKGITADGAKNYYNGSGLSTSSSDAGKYYWACITFEFRSEKSVNTQFDAYLEITSDSNQQLKSTQTSTTLGNLKHKGYSIVNQVDNNTNIVLGNDGEVTITSAGHWDGSPTSKNSVLVNDLTYSGNYSISTDITVPDVSYPITETHNQGLVFYYEDSNNYLIACTNYQADTPNRMREVQITGVINGENLGWNDFWTDDITTKPNTKHTLTIRKEGAKFYPYINDVAIGYWYADGDYRYCLDLSSKGSFNATSKVGYHVDGDSGKTNTVTFSKITLSKITIVDNANYSSSNWTNKGTEDVWTFDETNKTITTINGAWMNNFLISNELESKNTTDDDSTISVKIKGTKFPTTEEKESRVGILPWYYDENNYVIIYLQWSATDRPSELHQIQMTGKINGQNLTVWDNGWKTSEWNTMWTDKTVIAPSDDITLTVKKWVNNGDSVRFKITVSNGTTSVEKEHGFAILPAQTGLSEILPNGKIGLYGQLDTFTFSNITKTYTN